MIKFLLLQNRDALALAVVGVALTFFIPAVFGAGRLPPPQSGQRFSNSATY